MSFVKLASGVVVGAAIQLGGVMATNRPKSQLPLFAAGKIKVNGKMQYVDSYFVGDRQFSTLGSAQRAAQKEGRDEVTVAFHNKKCEHATTSEKITVDTLRGLKGAHLRMFQKYG